MFDFQQLIAKSGREILVMSLNPCLDVSLTIEELAVGKTNYYKEYREDLGGKGSNVIRAIHALGGSGSLFSPDYPDDGSKVYHLMNQEGIKAYLVNLPGHLRINYKILDSGEHNEMRMTELNSPGNYLSDIAVRLLEREWTRQIEQDQLLVLSGSLAPGLSDDTYKQLTLAQHARGGRVVLDAKGETLKLALAAKPDIIKPNRDELAQASGMSCETLDEAVEAAFKLREMGADVVLASLAEDGAIITRGSSVFYAKAPQNPGIKRLSGAGDAMTAVLACFAARDDDLTDDELPDVLVWAMAASQAAISREGVEMAGLSEVAAWADQIKIEKIR